MVEKAQVPCTDDGDDVVIFEGGIANRKIFCKAFEILLVVSAV